MPSSVRRKFLRQFLGVYRKLGSIWWIGRHTVGVCQFVRTPRITAVDRSKADDGAERSFLHHCKKKRKRGQRLGKMRSRGGKPRSSSPIRPELPKSVASRVVNHSGRKFIWGEKKRTLVCRSRAFLFLENVISRSYQPIEDKREFFLADHFGDPLWHSWAAYLRGLRSTARKAGIPDGANPFEKSALDFILTNTSLGGEIGFMDILGGLRIGVSPSSFGAFHDAQEKKDLQSDSDHEPPPAKLPPKGRKGSTKKRLSTGRGPFCSCAVGGYSPSCPTHGDGRITRFAR
jgi:hypothetical protein